LVGILSTESVAVALHRALTPMAARLTRPSVATDGERCCKDKEAVELRFSHTRRALQLAAHT
jgi:hypothetical protein